MFDDEENVAAQGPSGTVEPEAPDASGASDARDAPVKAKRKRSKGVPKRKASAKATPASKVKRARKAKAKAATAPTPKRAAKRAQTGSLRNCKNTPTTKLGRAMRKARLAKGINQYDLAVKCGVRQPTISTVESGVSTPSADLEKRIRKALRI